MLLTSRSHGRSRSEVPARFRPEACAFIAPVCITFKIAPELIFRSAEYWAEHRIRLAKNERIVSIDKKADAVLGKG